MSLSPRQRTKVNAALSLITLAGHNPRPVQAAAKRFETQGHPSNDAYSKALEWFVRQTPAMLEPLGTILSLVEYSDDATLARYDTAIDAFNQTGDNAQLEALAPMIVEDFKALIVKTGQATAEEVAAEDWNISFALGVTPETIAAEPWAPTPEEFGIPTPETPAAETAATEGETPVAKTLNNPAQVSPFANPTGYRPGSGGAVPSSPSRPAFANPNGLPPGWIQTATGVRRSLSPEQQRQADAQAAREAGE